MTAEAHIWAAMADLGQGMGKESSTFDEIHEKLLDVVFIVRRWEREQTAPKPRSLGVNASVSLPRTAAVNHRRDRLAGIHVVDEDGGPSAA